MLNLYGEVLPLYRNYQGNLQCQSYYQDAYFQTYGFQGTTLGGSPLAPFGTSPFFSGNYTIGTPLFDPIKNECLTIPSAFSSGNISSFAVPGMGGGM